MEIDYGQAKRTEEPLQSDFLGREGGMGRAGTNSQADGYDALPDHEGCPACQNWINRFFTKGYPDFAKVLERLLEIEEEHLAYVEAHQERLKARLEESSESKKRTVGKITSLRADIQAIMSQEQE